ncbi:uncharacterized protein CTRU02_201456 [Colletotrichum truncatum]|uniref:Uncharacterized protein n=1 Tax=Colletotrichum truncatum TaxID=5467 RepID=A0ACC3ZHK4_COLTU|nr:uncharacterized protein CTRU02_14327 [Colletotrichum truncatum]KAF6782288.1 hypothetical protein CTRU02_14327 [Colletotrichum truncatum]
MLNVFKKLSLQGANRDDLIYTKIPKDEEIAGRESETSKTILRREPSITKRAFVIAARLIVTLLAVYGLFTLLASHFPSTFKSHSLSCNCGDTIEEARARGCVYDSLAAAWLPKHCRSPTLTAEFEALGPNEPDTTGNTWGYWHDQNQTHPMTLEEVSQLPEAARHGQHARFFTTHEWHLVHCVFYWRKMWEAARCAKGVKGAACGENGVLVIEKRYDTLMHINHCMTMMLLRDPLDKIAAEAGVALHSDELHVAKPHKHESTDGHHGTAVGGAKSGDPYDKMDTEHKHGQKTSNGQY